MDICGEKMKNGGKIFYHCLSAGYSAAGVSVIFPENAPKRLQWLAEAS